MIAITHSADFPAAGIEVALGCIQCRVSVAKSHPALQAELEAEEKARLESLGGRPA